MRRGMGVDWLHAGWQGLGHLRRRWGTARRRRDLQASGGRVGSRVASTQEEPLTKVKEEVAAMVLYLLVRYGTDALNRRAE